MSATATTPTATSRPPCRTRNVSISFHARSRVELFGMDASGRVLGSEDDFRTLTLGANRFNPYQHFAPTGCGLLREKITPQDHLNATRVLLTAAEISMRLARSAEDEARRSPRLLEELFAVLRHRDNAFILYALAAGCSHPGKSSDSTIQPDRLDLCRSALAGAATVLEMKRAQLTNLGEPSCDAAVDAFVVKRALATVQEAIRGEGKYRTKPLYPEDLGL